MAATAGGRDVTQIAERHGLSAEAVRVLAEALRTGHGSAQWSHPDLGGMGQWSGGGMLQIGDMFNDALKARVRAVLEELASRPNAGDHPVARTPDEWWPAAFGIPSSRGTQNTMRYACFPDRKRLVIEQDGQITIYDTGAHKLTGFAQAQGLAQRLTFNGPDGPVTLDELAVIE